MQAASVASIRRQYRGGGGRDAVGAENETHSRRRVSRGMGRGYPRPQPTSGSGGAL